MRRGLGCQACWQVEILQSKLTSFTQKRESVVFRIKGGLALRGVPNAGLHFCGVGRFTAATQDGGPQVYFAACLSGLH